VVIAPTKTAETKIVDGGMMAWTAAPVAGSRSGALSDALRTAYIATANANAVTQYVAVARAMFRMSRVPIVAPKPTNV
jgi:ABC-type dipeptide/oligopeptide/nickel transport system permease component